jgi:hypothetical protein
MLLSRIQSRSSNPVLVRTAAILLFAALTAISARLTILLPFTPVPITLQVMIVLLAGLTLGAKDGALSQIVSATIAIGLPFDRRINSGICQRHCRLLIGFIRHSSPAVNRKREKRIWFRRQPNQWGGDHTIGTAWLTIRFLGNDSAKAGRWARTVIGRCDQSLGRRNVC